MMNRGVLAPSWYVCQQKPVSETQNWILLTCYYLRQIWISSASLSYQGQKHTSFFLVLAKLAPWKFHRREVGTWGPGGCETSVRGECCKLRLSFPKPPSPAGPGQRKECCKLCNTFPPQLILAVKSAASWSPKCLYSTSTGFRLLGSSSLSGRGGKEEGKLNIENEGIWIWSGLGQSECQRRSESNLGWRGN